MMIFTKAYFPVRVILTHYIEHFLWLTSNLFLIKFFQ